MSDTELNRHGLVLSCVVFGTCFSVLSALSTAILVAVNWRPWRIYSWIFARKWPWFLQGPQLSLVAGLLCWAAWAFVLSPIVVLLLWGMKLIALLDHTTIGLAVIMVGTALLLAFYAIMLWWRTQWQSSRAVFVLLLLAVTLLCGYEFAAVYVSAGRSASHQYSPSAFFFGVSAIAMGINMLFICKMVFHGSGLDVDEYVRRSYKFAHADCIEVGPVACMPEPPDPRDPALHKQNRAFRFAFMYFGSVLVLVGYSVLYGLTARKARWLGGVTSAAVMILDANVGACLFGFQLLKRPVVALVVAGVYRIILISFGVYYWYLGHCISYAVVATVLLGAAVKRHLAVLNPSAARRAALEHTVVRLREGFRKKGLGSSSSFSDGRTSSAMRSSSVEAAQLGVALEAMSRAGIRAGEIPYSGLASQHHGSIAAQHGAIGVIEECAEDGSSPMPDDSDRAVARQVGLGAGIEEKSLTPRQAVSSEADAGLIPGDRQGLSERYRPISHGPDFGHSHGHSLESFSSIVGPLDQLDHLALMFQERLNDPRIMAMLRGRRGAEQDLTSLLEDKGLDPNFAVMLKEKGLDPTLLALLQRSSLDADNDHRDNTDIGTGGNPSQNASLPEEGVTWSEELRRKKWETWVHPIRFLVQLFAGTPERAWVLFSVLFVQETILIAIFRPQNVTVINASHEQFEFGFSALLLSPVVCSIMAFFRIMKAEEMYLTARARKYGLVAWILNTSVGLLLAFLSKSSIILGLALAVPLIAASLSVALPLWVRNGYRFYKPKASEQGDGSQPPQTKGICGQGQDMPMTVAIIICIGAIIGLGLIISFKPLDDLSYSGWSGPQPSSDSPYTSSLYLGWAIASALVLIITGLLPAVSWFATYRFSFSSAVCVAIFIVVLVTSCGGSYMGIVHARDGRVPVQADFIAAILPLMCIPAALLLGCGLYKWKDEGWQLSRGVYACLGVGLLLLLGAISAIIAMIDPWMVGVAFLLFLVMMVLTIGVVHHWASHNFYLTRMETILVCLSTFVLALAAFLVGLLADEPFVGASVGYFAFLFLLGGRSLTVLLSPPVVVYSPRVLPVYVYDAHADCAKNVSGAFLVLYGIALGTAGWGVVASLEIYPPFAGAAVSATTLVVAFGFAVSRPQSTVKRMEDALHFLKKDTIVQAIARSSTKTRNALSGTYSAPQRSASSAALLVGDAAMARDKAGNFVLPRADVLKLRERLRNEELAAGLFWCKPGVGFIRHDSTLDVGYRRKLCAHARILALEEAIDTEWVYMWDKFGGYLLLVLGLAARAERVQDEVRLRLFLDSIGSSDLSAKEIRSWTTEDRKRFEMVQEDYMREKEMEEELMQQRREEEGKGKERRKALLEKEERRRREIEASVIASVPDVGTKEAAAMAAAVRAVGGDVLFDESKAGDQVLSIARHILVAQRARRAQETGVTGAQCIIDDEPRSVPRPCGVLDPSLCGSRKVTFSAAVLVQPESGPICLMGSEAQQRICWEILIAGAEQGLEAGQVGLRLVVKGAGQTTLVKQWNIGNTSLADGRWHTVTVTLDAEVGEAATYLDGHFDGAAPLESLNGLQIPAEKGIWEDGTEVWVGIRPPMDLDAFGRSDSEGNDSRMHVMDVFLWGRLLTEDEIMSVHHSTSSSAEEYNEHNLPDDDWRGSPIESPMEEWAYEVPDLDLNDHDELYWDDQPANGRKRKAEKETLAIDMDYISRKLRRPKMETQEEVTQRMRALELAVKEALAARGETHFTDQEFPPTNHSLHVDPDHPMPKLQVVREWLRPGAAVREASPISPPCLFSGPANASDVCQGRLGDCWFLSAVAVLTEASKIAEVIVTPEFNEEGIYTVRFCIQGEWVAVVVDDWIPCEARGKPAFATSRKGNELWVSILEKAYAKLHGSYEALDAGVVQDALVDLTGGAGEEIDMTSPHVQLDLASGRLWTQLVRFKQEGFLLGAGSPSGSDASVSSSGIVQGHAYSLLQVCEVDGHKLVQIRNPWANEVEWNGPWSDLSAEWTDRMKHKLKYTPQAADGVFWMSWQDFQLHFRSLYVCRIYPPEMRYSVRGQWRSSSAGGCQDYDTWHQNPQFHLKAVGADARLPIHVFVTLTQIQGVGFSSRSRPGYRNVQSGGDSSLFYIGMRIIKTRGRRSGPNIYMHEAVTGTDYVNTREIPCEMVLEPDPDGYTIVPTTYAPGQECQFLLSVFTKAAITLEPL